MANVRDTRRHRLSRQILERVIEKRKLPRVKKEEYAKRWFTKLKRPTGLPVSLE